MPLLLSDYGDSNGRRVSGKRLAGQFCPVALSEAIVPQEQLADVLRSFSSAFGMLGNAQNARRITRHDICLKIDFRTSRKGGQAGSVPKYAE